MENEIEHKWRFSKNVTLGHVVSTAVLGSSVFFYMSSIDKRIEQNTQAIRYLKEERDEIKADLRAISTKLDRLIERS